MASEVLLAALRSSGPSERDQAYRILFTAEEAASVLRGEVARGLAQTLRPHDREIVRWLLEREIAKHEEGGCGASETLLVLVAALARFADPTDALLIWRAQNATPETQAAVDVEHLLRAGQERVRRHLQSLILAGGPEAEEAARALVWLERGVADGAASDLPAYFAWSDERFGIALDCPTCRFAAETSALPAE